MTETIESAIDVGILELMPCIIRKVAVPPHVVNDLRRFMGDRHPKVVFEHKVIRRDSSSVFYIHFENESHQDQVLYDLIAFAHDHGLEYCPE